MYVQNVVQNGFVGGCTLLHEHRVRAHFIFFPAKKIILIDHAVLLQMMLCDEDRKWYFRWLAWAIDMTAFCVAFIGYLTSGFLIFYVNAKASR
jgi:hypothetical protein